MTCKEKLQLEHPECVYELFGFCNGCPSDYGYLDDPEYCYPSESVCIQCWDREIPEDGKTEQPTNSEPHILDSGDRTEFETGAVRDMREGKGRCDLLPLDVLALVSYDVVLSSIFVFQEEEGNYGALINLIQCNSIFDNLYTMSLEVAKHFEDGAKKYGENNWQKGIPVHCYIDSALRHYLKYRRGDKDEPHDRAFVWNILCCIWTCIHKPELNDYAKGKEQNK